VRDKFPSASESNTERLGKAICRRRQYFKYREMHHQKLSHGLDDDAIDDTGTSTVASSIPQHMKTAASRSSSDIAVLDEDNFSEGGFSDTSYASSASDEKLRVPPLPPLAEEGPFECPFCYMMISATTTRAWKYVFWLQVV
jgi:hypothetical protein